MKKIIIYLALFFSLLLGGCSFFNKPDNQQQPNNQSDSNVIKKQELTFDNLYSSLIDKLFDNIINGINSYGISPAKDSGYVKVSGQSPMGGGEATISYNGEHEYSSEVNKLNLNVSAKGNIDINNQKSNFDISGVFRILQDKAFVKIDNLDIKGNENFSMMVNMYKNIIGKWIILQNESNSIQNKLKVNPEKIGELLSLIKSSLKENPILSVSKESKEGDYKVFELIWNKDNIIKVYDNIMGSSIIKDFGITDEDIKQGKKDLENNLEKIDETKCKKILKAKDLENYIFSIERQIKSVSSSGTVNFSFENKNDKKITTFKLNNKRAYTEENISFNLTFETNGFNISLSAKDGNGKLELSLTKNGSKISGQGFFEANGSKLFDLNIDGDVGITKNKIDGLINIVLNTISYGKYNISVKKTIEKTDSVVIEEPKNYMTTEQIQQQMMENMRQNMPQTGGF